MAVSKAPQAPDTPSVLSRRDVLAGLLTAYTFSLIPWAAAQPVDNAAHGAFVAVSAILVGRPSLDVAQARRLYDALTEDDPGFPTKAQALLTWINERRIDPMELHDTLKSESHDLSGVPGTIATAWFLGIVGSGEKARSIAFETALNAQIVSDVLRPPTYAYGAYGSWSSKPSSGSPR